MDKKIKGREAYELSDKAVMDDFKQFDVCIHGYWPNESDCGCTHPAAPKVLVNKWKELARADRR